MNFEIIISMQGVVRLTITLVILYHGSCFSLLVLVTCVLPAHCTEEEMFMLVGYRFKGEILIVAAMQ